MEFVNLIDNLYERGSANFAIKLGLTRIEELAERIGNPQNSYKVIHITGTNGKGSVTKAVSDIFIGQGLKVGTYISPHLVSITERIKVNGKNITENEFMQTYLEIESAIKEMDKKGKDFSPSFFEIITALAFKFFEKEKVDLAVLEVGLGGRLDATNVVNSDVSVITSISKDHIKTLGDSEEKIAFEKAGILKKDNFVILGNIDQSPKNVILERSKEVGVNKVLEFNKDFYFENPRYHINENLLDYKGINLDLKDLQFKANGTFQMQNVTIALATTEAFAEKYKIDLSVDKLRETMKNFVWEGRFDYTEINGKKLILDGAHNVAAAEQLRTSVEVYCPNESKTAMVGILNDKDYINIAKIISPIFDKIIITSVPSSRGKDPEAVFEEFKKWNNNVEFIPDTLEAFMKLFSEKSDVYFVTGSLYLVGKIKEFFSTNLIS
ncbi:MAG TPA: folylpolyglutamate synthase/dihydrofolate synthase family protein [Defluviitoga sp.]|nr:folylpolyglutamate synthase/dihydrofolate synthase family protein [Defluviitoga sp.]HOP25047.1 folylpolyglutamate synthase/dihydrofolate synthase family protein [Defluviitoga sp.]HPZ29199.1 folylpolyglutamate synthase/dihydrofolate synthase family protein [Defluviitoga sp.]HQD63106.1 folylpolyglutamate synthase/dihydrofolate synthase family protein [Defluviitoga sp.]